MKIDFNEIELRKLDLNLLLVFSALMREGGVTRAAKRLFMGPSAVSMALGRLREMIGDELFIRAGPGMEPTPRALTLWRGIEPALAGIEMAIRETKHFDPARAKMIFRFAAPDDLEFVLVPLLVERLAREAPGVRLVVRPADFRTLLDRLDQGDADLALSAAPTSGIERRHHVQPLFREGFSTVYDARRLDREGPLDLETYLDVPHLLLSITGDLSGLIDETLRGLGFSRRILAAVSHFPTIPFVLKRCRALANIPSVAARHFAETYGLEIGPPPIESPSFEVSLAWHARTDRDPAHIWFRELVTGAVADIVRPSESNL